MQVESARRGEEPDSAEGANDKLIRLLFLVGEHGAQDGARLAELVRESGYTKPTVHRLLGDLRRHGLVEQDETSARYRLGRRVLALSAQCLGGRDLRRSARPVMESLAAELGYTVHLGVRDGTDVVYVEKVDPPSGWHLASTIGMRRPLELTAMGKALVAAEAGSPPAFSIDDQESYPGFRCAGAAILDHLGRPIAAMSATGPTSAFRKSQFAMVGAKVLAAALALSAAMGFVRVDVAPEAGRSRRPVA